MGAGGVGGGDDEEVGARSPLGDYSLESPLCINQNLYVCVKPPPLSSGRERKGVRGREIAYRMERKRGDRA